MNAKFNNVFVLLNIKSLLFNYIDWRFQDSF